MRFLMKQKWLIWGDSFVIKDELQRDVLYVQGAVFSWGNQRSIREPDGLEVAEIKQVIFAWGPTYEVFRNGALAAKVTKEIFTFFKCRFMIDVPGPDDLEAEGDFWDCEYTFSRRGQVVAQISKQWFSWTDTYGVDVAAGEDALLILASTVVIDCCCHDNRRNND